MQKARGAEAEQSRASVFIPVARQVTEWSFPQSGSVRTARGTASELSLAEAKGKESDRQAYHRSLCVDDSFSILCVQLYIVGTQLHFNSSSSWELGP